VGTTRRLRAPHAAEGQHVLPASMAVVYGALDPDVTVLFVSTRPPGRAAFRRPVFGSLRRRISRRAPGSRDVLSGARAADRAAMVMMRHQPPEPREPRECGKRRAITAAGG
jgi:hypothetical protein